MSSTSNPQVSVIPRQVESTPIKGLYLITEKQVIEQRGAIREAYRKSSFSDMQVDQIGPWMQINVTETKKGAIRGIHAENMNKLVGVVSGEGFGAYVDLREDSPTKGVVFTTTLTKGKQVFVPKGVGNSFQSVSDEPTQYLYCFDEEWVPEMKNSSITPFDPELNIEWPIAVDPQNRDLVSEKDFTAPLLKDILPE
jgi:dTDP-4-dehydrorhamnose 3,5-epimerase